MADVPFQSSAQIPQGGTTGATGLVIVKSGTIVLSPGEFSGSPPRASDYVLIKKFTTDTTSEALFLSYDVYHWSQQGAFPGTWPVTLDEAVIKCPYSYSQQRAVVWFGWEDTAGPGFELRLYVDYTAPSTSGESFSSNATQTFYYMVYSQNPLQP